MRGAEALDSRLRGNDGLFRLCANDGVVA
jgi:hypothetical protein